MEQNKGYCDGHNVNCAKIVDLEEKIDELTGRVTEIEKNHAVSKQEIKMIFNILNEIKDSIKVIAAEIKEMKERPGRKWDEVSGAVVMVAVTSVVTYIMAKLL